MTARNDRQKPCAICGKSFPLRSVVSGEIVRKEIAAEILKSYPEWSAEKFICRADLVEVRGKFVHSLLESEKGELTSLEQEVVRSLREHELLSSDIESEFEQQWSFGERLADKIATFGGSWARIWSSTVAVRSGPRTRVATTRASSSRRAARSSWTYIGTSSREPGEPSIAGRSARSARR